MNAKLEQPTKRLTLLEIVNHALSEQKRLADEAAAAYAQKDRAEALDWIRAELRKIFGSELDQLTCVETDDQILIDGLPFRRGDEGELEAGVSCANECTGRAWTEVKSVVGIASAMSANLRCTDCLRNECGIAARRLTIADRLEMMVREIVREELEGF